MVGLQSYPSNAGLLITSLKAVLHRSTIAYRSSSEDVKEVSGLDDHLPWFREHVRHPICISFASLTGIRWLLPDCVRIDSLFSLGC